MLVIQEDIHPNIKLHQPEQICSFFEYSGKYILLTGEVYLLPIFRGCVAMSIRSSNLTASTTNFYHDLAIVSLTKRNRYTPKHVNYLPLAINIIRNIEIHITDFEESTINLDDSQPIITLHFK
jgi:hypothetical protein